jgi:hypothetical protein
LKNNTATHTPKFEKRKKSSIANRGTDLRSPTSVTVRSERRAVLPRRRNSIGIRLHVQRSRKVNKQMDGRSDGRSESNAIVMGGVNVMKSVESGFHVAWRRLTAVWSEEGVSGGNVRASGAGQPTNASNQTLICFRTPNLSRRIIRVFRRCNGVYGNPRAVGSRVRGRLPLVTA